ncbi:unnamed protein product, partial [Ilex paraguariensis]
MDSITKVDCKKRLRPISRGASGEKLSLYSPSAIGKPLYVDSLTTSKRRLSHARICTE